MASISEISEAFVDEFARLDPVRAARSMGVGGDAHHLPDYSPAGIAATADLFDRTATALRAGEPADEAERVGRLYLLDTVEGEAALVEHGERGSLVSALVGPPAALRLSFDLLSKDSEADWERIADRLELVPGALAGYRASLDEAAGEGRVASRSVVSTVADQCRTWGQGAGWFAAYVAPYDGPLADRLGAAARAAGAAYGELGEWFATTHLARASAEPGVGDDRYRVWARSMLGTELDLDETYAWGWHELARLEEEKRTECDRITPGGSFEEVAELLSTDPARGLDDADAYQGWLQEISDDATARLNGVHFDIPEPLLRCEIGIPPEGSASAPYYTPPTEDLSQPGRTWFPVNGRTHFATWSEVTIAYHEAVPGHHLQLGWTRFAPLIRAHRLGFQSAHGEGWALYAERLMDELGFFTTPDTRLGFLASQAFRAARVVVDIGLHTGRTIAAGWPGEGERWTPAMAVGYLERSGGVEPRHAQSEVQRYLSWPAQALTYKVGERAWLDARASARAAQGAGFDLKAWHAKALALGALGLADLRREMSG